MKGAVVNVDVQARNQQAVRTNSPFEEFFGGGRRFGPQQSPQLRAGAGSGFIVDPKGRVLTNNHVIEGAVSIRVRLEDGRSYKAEIVGRDPLTDLAVLQLQDVDGELPSVTLGDSDAMAVGDWVMAVGNPFGLASSVSAGIISARARDIHSGPYDDFLQTDAAINPGNSGGPLFNLAGEVIGINTAIIGGATGIGFAVPSNMAKVLMPQLEQGIVRRGWLGVSIRDLDEKLGEALKLDRSSGALVVEVNEGTPAETAGLMARDLIVALDGKPLSSSRELTKSVGFKPPGAEVALTVYRDGEEREVKVALGERPDFERVGLGRPEGTDASSRIAELGLQLEDSGGAQARGGLRSLRADAAGAGRCADHGRRAGISGGARRPARGHGGDRGQRDAGELGQGAAPASWPRPSPGRRCSWAWPAGRGGALRALEIP